MENTAYRKEIMGLLMLPPEKRIESIERLLIALGHHFEGRELTYLGCFRGKDFYIDGDSNDAELFQKYMDIVRN